MARDANGNYSLDSSNPVVSGTVIASDWANNTLADIAATLQDSLSRSGKGPMTATLRLADAAGTLAVGGLTFDSERNTGIYRPAANKLAVCISGTDVILLSKASGAIGNTYTCPGSPTACAHVFDDAGASSHALDIARFNNHGVINAKVDYTGRVFANEIVGWTNGVLKPTALIFKDGNVAEDGISQSWNTARAHTSGKLYEWNNGGYSKMYMDWDGHLHVLSDMSAAQVSGTSLLISGAAAFDAGVSMTGTLGVAGTFGCLQLATVESLAVTHGATFSGTVNVNGAINFNAAVTFGYATSFTEPATFSDVVNFDSAEPVQLTNMTVSGTAVFESFAANPSSNALPTAGGTHAGEFRVHRETNGQDVVVACLREEGTGLYHWILVIGGNNTIYTPR